MHSQSSSRYLKNPLAPAGESHHKQFVLLQPKKPPQNQRNASVTVPVAQLTPRSASGDKKKKLQKLPITPSKSRFIFSVDDAEDEIEQDLEREYLEGYHDALRGKLRKKLSKNPLVSPNLAGPPGDNIDGKTAKELENTVTQNLLKVEEGLKELEMREDDFCHQVEAAVAEDDELSQQPSHSEQSEVVPEEADDQVSETSQPVQGPIVEENSGSDGTESISSIESFTLRERQDAINTTHPFGIRIWKPAIYKKFRSVQKEADMDIHEEEDSSRLIHNSVYIGNFLWSWTFGLFCLVICSVGLLLSIIFFGWTDNSLEYAQVFWKLGIYLWYPFGKVVYLYKDENYIQEDFNEGSSINEYRRWANDLETGYLFTSNHNTSNDETRPLLSETSSVVNYSTTLQPSDPEYSAKVRLFGRGQWSIGRIFFFIYFYLILQPVLLLISTLCWLLVFTIPMAKVTFTLCTHLRQRPLSVFFKSDKNTKISSKDASVLLCTYRASGLHYYKYTVDGTNIIILNLMAIVLFVIFDFYFIREFLGIHNFFTDSTLIFFICLLSIIPLAYFIGQAVASISAQSSMSVGAVINAFFSTIVEIYLYCVALKQQKGRLVEGSMIGSILGAVLLLPGLSMCAGAIKRKTQRYNPRSAGVSSTILLFSTVVMLSPSIFHLIFGIRELRCFPCNTNNDVIGATVESVALAFVNMEAACEKCHISQPPLRADKLYTNILKPFTLFAGIVLFFSYLIALWFTLRTHAALIWQGSTSNDNKHVPASFPNSESLKPAKHSGLKSPSILSLSDSAPNASATRPSVSRRVSSAATPKVRKAQDQVKLAAEPSETPRQQQMVIEEHIEDSSSGHDAPNWSRTKSAVILLGATVLYAVIAEILVDCVDAVLKQFPINPKFLGLTVFALVPNTTEFLNAISFAMYGNVALSMEIGSAYVLQVIQLQIPALLLFSVWRLSQIPPDQVQNWDLSDNMLALVFPLWDCVSAITSVYIFTYIYAEGKSNYFKGSLLILLYLVVMLGFYYSGQVLPNVIQV